MSLKIWLPLNGNLNNFGCSNINIITTGTTTFLNGKIGKGLFCDGISSWTIEPITLNVNTSICCWIKTSINNKILWTLNSDTYGNLNLSTYNGIYCLNTDNENNNSFKDNNNNDIIAYTDELWHHLAVTFNNNIVKLYIDGVFCGAAATFKSPIATNKSIAIGGNSSNYNWSGMVNDFRIYDHTLSITEIKEIAKGLVIHYKLDTIQNNIIQDSSGYNYNGILINTPIISNDSIIYSHSTYFESENIKIESENNNPITDSITINFWIKYNSGTSLICSNENNGWHFTFNPVQFSIYVVNLTTSEIENKLIQSQISLQNVWTMVSGVYDRINQKIKLFINGEKIIEGNTNNSNIIYYNNDIINISGGINGFINDFRIYCTPLSDIDIKSLYNTRIKVDNFNNFHSFELKEENNTNKISINKKGIIKTNEIIENNSVKFNSQYISAKNFIEM